MPYGYAPAGAAATTTTAGHPQQFGIGPVSPPILEDREAVVPAGATTVAIALESVPQGEAWRIERITVSTDHPDPEGVPVHATVYFGEPSRRGLRDGTRHGHLDVAEYPAGGLVLPGGQRLVVEWQGAAAGTRVFLAVQYRREVT